MKAFTAAALSAAAAAGAITAGAWATPSTLPPLDIDAGKSAVAADPTPETVAVGGKVRLGPAAFTVVCTAHGRGVVRCTIPPQGDGWRPAKIKCRFNKRGGGACVVSPRK